jgi:hypothetical protein
MSPVMNIKKIRPVIWIPPQSTPEYRITVEKDGVEEDITQLCSDITVEDYVTESIGKFSFNIYNGNDEHTNKWIGNEIFRYCNDTTLAFRGRIEIPSKQTFKLNVFGRSESLVFLEKKVTKQYVNTECSAILRDIIDTYGAGFTYNNVNTSTIAVTINWYRKPFWDCVKDLCVAAGFEAWVGPDLDFYFFQSGSVDNQMDAIVHDINLIEVQDFAPDITQVKNQIRVNGASIAGAQVLYTANDTTSQALYGVRIEDINDNGITSYEQAVDTGEYELSVKKDPPLFGSVQAAYLLGDYKPGEKIRISAPSENLPYNYYVGIGYKDELKFEQGQLMTTVYLSKLARQISTVLKDRIQTENALGTVYSNPYDMDDGYISHFDEVSGTPNNTAISNSTLYATSVGGYWISPVRTLNQNITQAYLILTGNELQNVTVEVSGNGGSSYVSITNGSLANLGASSGIELVYKVTLATTTASVDSVNMMYRY